MHQTPVNTKPSQFSEVEIFNATLRLMKPKYLFKGEARLFPYAAIFGNKNMHLNNNLIVGIA
jgi:hypothetical protein